jgi:hypothetical protein
VIKTANEVEHGASEAADSRERHAAAYLSVWSVVLTLSASERCFAPSAWMSLPQRLHTGVESGIRATSERTRMNWDRVRGVIGC